jgi:hemerythrin-like domain-containing protein
MNAIQLLKQDHRTVESLFAQYKRLGDGATTQKKVIVDKLVHELSIHAAIEEQILYPTARKAVTAKDDLVLESLEEHHLVKWLLSELTSLKPTSERYDAKVTVLEEAVKHHVEEEESDLFPALQKKLDPRALAQMGDVLAAAKKIAPTRPHPNAPDEPPGNLLASLPAAMLDRMRDLVSGGMHANGTASRGKRSMTASATMNRMVRGAKRAIRKVAPKRGTAKRTASKRGAAKRRASKKAR